MANLADTTYSVIREVVAGTTPAPPAFKRLDITDATFTLESSMLNSEVLKSNRAAGDSVEQGFYVNGNFKTDFRRDTTVDLMLEGGFGGTFATNVLKAGNTDLSHTFEQKMLSNTGSPLYFRAAGSQITDLGITVDATSKVELSGSFIGLGQTNANAIITGATYADATQGPLYTGGGAGSITIAGLTATYYSLDFKIAHTRSPRFGLFNPNALGISTGGNRQVSLTLQLYRDDLNPESVFVQNTPIVVSFAFGSGANNVYTFSLPRMFAKRPARSTNENNELVTVELTGANDATAATDVSVTKS